MRKGNVMMWWFMLQWISLNNRIYRFHHCSCSDISAFLILFLCIFRITRCCIDWICVSGDLEYTQRPTSSRLPITAWQSTVLQCHGRSQLYLADLSCIRLIWNKALMHYDTTVGCNSEAPLKGGSIQKLDSVQGHSDSVTHCKPGLNLKVGKMRPHLSTWDPIWAKCSKSGQNFSRGGQKKFIHWFSFLSQMAFRLS